MTGRFDAAPMLPEREGSDTSLCIGVSADNASAVKSLTERYVDVDCSIGVHPLDLEPTSQPALDWLLSELQHPHAVAIGETGWTTTTSPRRPNSSSSRSACIWRLPD